MRIIVVGEKLDNYLFEIVKSTEHFGCDVVFFKRNINTKINAQDVIIIDCSIINSLPTDLNNMVISVISEVDYKRTLENEISINFSSIGSIGKIIEEKMSGLPIVVDESSVKVFRIAEKVARTNATVLITGETGTGKEVLARHIHEFSDRYNRKFVTINCAAIPDTLLESELFGHEKGAFTNAIQRRIGKFEEANGGTILLDEISEMSLNLQAKFLRIIQEKEFSRLGSNTNINVDARIIATSNKNLYNEVLNGTFREDLFYRLSVVPIKIPRLCERPMDIIPLAIFFCKKYSNSKKQLSTDLLQTLKNNKWSGNIRELENFIHRAVIFSTSDMIDIKDITFDFRKFQKDININDNFREYKTLAQIERDTILEAMKKFNGNKMIVSEKLGIPVRTLRYKLNSYAQESRNNSE